METSTPQRSQEHDFGYEKFALQYDAGSQVSPFNRLLDRPTVVDLLDWSGQRVLEAGCAGGLLTAELEKAGARVRAFDVSPTLVALAAERAPDSEVFVHDLHQALPVENHGVDVVVASLVLHYIEDWAPVLAEFRRVLVPGGVLIITTGHPLSDLRLSDSGNYYATELVHDVWSTDFGDPPLDVRFFRRPLAESMRYPLEAGFHLSRLIEPQAKEEHRHAFGPKFDKVHRSPWFLVVEWHAPEVADAGA